MFAVMDDMNTDPVQVTTDRKRTEIRIRWGATTVKLSVAEAVDLVDALATTLAEQPRVSVRRTPLGVNPRRIERDEAAVRAAVEVREAL
ncbi:hypothetical protein [Rhodococcus sp. UNC23MFCrub1.1]|uniref:hypothetical protein n=1 Tax=Rhodococcus sp. UNC23MFCrub1.1 TaxID=1449068 RepID=UPI00047F0750|nr:hypothetical protein [Rhodococcus sp. UNC23MFCrub1.1]